MDFDKYESNKDCMDIMNSVRRYKDIDIIFNQKNKNRLKQLCSNPYINNSVTVYGCIINKDTIITEVKLNDSLNKYCEYNGMSD